MDGRESQSAGRMPSHSIPTTWWLGALQPSAAFVSYVIRRAMLAWDVSVELVATGSNEEGTRLIRQAMPLRFPPPLPMVY